MMRSDWREFALAPDTTIRDTLQAIDRCRLGIALVVDADATLLGTVTDGDIRRAILREIPLDAPAAQIMSRNFVALPQGAGDELARESMIARKIKHLPVLGAQGRLVGMYFLPDLLSPLPKPNWAVVMAGGEGRRLRPLTEQTPKPMLPVGDQPLLEISVRRLVSHGFGRIFLAVNYRSEQIEQHFGDGAGFGCRIEYLREDRPLDTGGALTLLPEAPNAALLVVNGDLITDVDFEALLDHHAQHRSAATLCVREFSHEIPYGVVRCSGDAVVGLEEKPVQRVLINAGIYVLEPRLLALLPPATAYALPQLLEDALARGERVNAFLVHERWVDIGLPVDYERVRHGIG